MPQSQTRYPTRGVANHLIWFKFDNLMRTLERYLVREVLFAWMTVTVVLVLVVTGSYVGRYLGEIAAGELPSNLLIQVLVLKMVGSMPLLLPASLFIGAMLALGRLFRDSEIVVMSATGVGPLKFYRALAFIGVPAAIALAILSLWVAPGAAAMSERLQQEAARTAELATLQSGQFQRVSGDRVIYAGDVAHQQNVLNRIIIFAGEGDQVDVLSAAGGEYFTEPQSGRRYLRLENGVRTTGIPGQAEFSLLSFARGTLFMPIESTGDANLDMEAQPTAELIRNPSGWYKAELHWRLAMPVSVLILLLLVLPAARLGPRESRYGKLVLGFLIYFAYANLLGLGRAWMEHNQVPLWFGLWWVHLLLFALALCWLWRLYRRRPA